MRIRKRQVPLSLSSLSPVPLSDPVLNRSPVVQLQLHDATNPLGNLTPQGDRDAHFDQPNLFLSMIGGGSSGLDCLDDAGGTHQGNKKKDFSSWVR